jgi:hypothetical protein
MIHDAKEATTPHWTTEVPKEDGMYWFRGDSRTTLLEIEGDDQRDYLRRTYPGWEYYGPVTPPD